MLRTLGKRLTAALLSVIMLFALLPTGAMASGEEPLPITVGEYHLMNKSAFQDYYKDQIKKEHPHAWGFFLNGIRIYSTDGRHTYRNFNPGVGHYNVYAHVEGDQGTIQPEYISHIMLYGTYAWGDDSVRLDGSEFEYLVFPAQSDTQAYAEIYFSQDAPEQPETATHTVTFDLGYAPADNSPQTAAQSVSKGSFAIEPEDPKRDGYTFRGWYAEGAQEAFDFDTPITADLTLTAKWEKKEIPPVEPKTTEIGVWHYFTSTPTRDNDKSGTFPRSDDRFTEEYIGSLPKENFFDGTNTLNVTYTGYTIWAYRDGATASVEVTLDADGHVDLTGVKELRIHLEYNPSLYKVIYDANGGADANDENVIEKRYNTANRYTILPNEGEDGPNFIRDGYTFTGWAKGAGGTNPVSVGTSAEALAKDQSVTYYAQWRKNEDPTPTTYTVTYDWGTANIPADATLPASASVTSGGSHTVDTTYPKGQAVKANGGTYTFSGWDRQGVIENISANTTITGSWAFTQDPVPPTTYTVTYQYTGSVPSGITPPVDSARYAAEAEVTLAPAPTVPANYAFTGWTLSGGLTAENGKFAMPEGNVTVTGAWTYTAPSGGGGTAPSRYTVTVNYLEQDTNVKLADPYVSARLTGGSAYNVTEQTALPIRGYTIVSVDGAPSGTLRKNETITVYYTADRDIPDVAPPLTPGPGDNGETDIPDTDVPTAPAPDTGESGSVGTPPAPPQDDTTIVEKGVPLGNLPQTGTTARAVDPTITLGFLALAASLAAAGLGMALSRKKKDEI